MPRVVHFEIGAEDPARAEKFYGDVFGWKMKKWEGPMDYWMATTGDESEPGINGGMARKEEGWQPHNTLAVPSVDEYIERITNAGGRITVPKMAIPTVGYLAYFQDPDGNTFAIMEEDESADRL